MVLLINIHMFSYVMIWIIQVTLPWYNRRYISTHVEMILSSSMKMITDFVTITRYVHHEHTIENETRMQILENRTYPAVNMASSPEIEKKYRLKWLF